MKRGSPTRLTRSLLAVAAAACIGLCTISAVAQDDDPPTQAGRLSIVNGNVSIQPAGTQDWGQAYLNYPIGPGDRIYTDVDGRAEIQVGRTYVRVGPNTDVTFVDFSSDAVTFGAAQGALHVRTRGLWDGQSLYVQTPSGTSTVTGPADFRVDIYPDQQAAIFTALDGYPYISGANDFGMDTQPGQALELVGTNPVYPQWLQPAPPDDLDNWSERRDAQIAQAASYRYVSPDAPGAEDLDAYGQWQPGTQYGDMWVPNVPAGWQPYHNGHWVNHDPWGWVWVEDEPWGYAPFHYGRWVNYQGRWGWVPGAREEHPVWSPALVAFAGGAGFAGGGMSVWFPLGPGEPYRPWYPCSPRYVNQVNITNIRQTNVVHVQNNYYNIVNVTNVTNITYVNRTAATAVRQQDFASGRSVSQVAVKVDPQQMAHVQVIAKPEVVPTRQAMISRPPARPVPVAVTRPTLINAKGLAVAAQPKARPVAPPQRTAPPPPSIPNRVVVAPPANVKMTPAARQAMQTAPKPVQQPGRPGQPAGQANAPGRPAAQPPAQAQEPKPIPGNQPRPSPIPTPGVRPPAQPAQQEPNRPAERPTPAPQPTQPERNQERPAQPARPTYQQPTPAPQRPAPTPPKPEERPAPYQQTPPPARPTERPSPTPQAQPRPETPPAHAAPPPPPARQNTEPPTRPAPRQQPPPPDKNKKPDEKEKPKPEA